MKEEDGLHLEILHEILEAMASIQGIAFSRSDSAGSASSLLGIGLAHPILHKQPHPSACIISLLLHKHRTVKRVSVQYKFGEL